MRNNGGDGVLSDGGAVFDAEQKIDQKFVHIGSDRNVVIQLDTKVNFCLCQVLDHELRLFRELEAIKDTSKDSTNVLKALRFIDRKRRDSLDRKQLLVFLNSNMEDAQMKMSDITTIFRRLNLKQSGQINYIDFFNSVYGRVNETSGGDAAKVR